MRLSPVTGFVGVWSKQTNKTRCSRGSVQGEGRDGVTELQRNSSLCIIYIEPQHSTLYASEDELTLFVFYSFIHSIHRDSFRKDR